MLRNMDPSISNISPPYSSTTSGKNAFLVLRNAVTSESLLEPRYNLSRARRETILRPPLRDEHPALRGGGGRYNVSP